MAEIDYLLQYHEIYYQRIEQLKSRVGELKARLPAEGFRTHETVKLAFRIRQAEREIAQDPHRPEYLLKAELRKFRRYKRGLGRYRILFCFSDRPPIIIFLYLNTESSLRKAGDKRDPYEEFRALVRQGRLSHDPSDPRLQKWITRRAGD